MKSLILLPFVVAHLSYGQDYNKKLKGLDKELTEILSDWDVAGYSVAIVDKNGIVYEKGFGYADLENERKAHEFTLYAIGSCTKSFTTALIGMLNEDDELSLDDKPSDHIPDFSFYNDEMNNTITIKDLMRHSTGLPRHDFAWYLFPSHDKDSLMERIQYQEPFAGVREQWYYNNFMFLTQGVITEKITGKIWEENVDERIFDRIGMNNSNLGIEDMKNDKMASFGYEVKDGSMEKMDYYDIAGMSPAGSINSSVHEMSNWLQTWINMGEFNGEQIIPESFVRQAIGSQMVIGKGLPDDEFPELHMSNYGYGWMTSSYKGHYRVEHGGNIDGFSANVCFFPSDSIGVIVLTNQNGSMVPALVRNTIADRLLNVERSDWSGNLRERYDERMEMQEESSSTVTSSKTEGTSPSHALIEYSGNYSHPGYGAFNITLRDDSLIADFTNMDLYLEHYHYDVFQPFGMIDGKVDTTDTGELMFNFASNDMGEITSLSTRIEPTLDPIEFKRVPNSIEVSQELLERYSGDYKMGPQTAKIYSKDDGVLYLFVAGQPEYELIAIEEHLFALKILDGFKVSFAVNEDGTVTAASFIQPNGTFTAERVAPEK